MTERRDATAIDLVAQVTRAADEMRKRSTHTTEVVEDADGVRKLRAEVSDAIIDLTLEVARLKSVIMEIGAAADASIARGRKQ